MGEHWCAILEVRKLLSGILARRFQAAISPEKGLANRIQPLAMSYLRGFATSDSATIDDQADFVRYVYGLCTERRECSEVALQDGIKGVGQILKELLVKDPLAVDRLSNYFGVCLRSVDKEVRRVYLSHLRSSVRGLYTWALLLTQSDMWESVADVFWLQHLLDLLLEFFVGDEPVSVAAGWSVFFPTTPAAESAVTPSVAESEMTSADSSIATLRAAFRRQCRMTHVVQGLRTMLEVSDTMASIIWTRLFPCIWSLMDADCREVLSRPLVVLMTRDFQKKQFGKKPSVVRALLEGCLRCDPRPEIAPDVLKFLARTFNAWHLCIPALEQKVVSFLPEVSGVPVEELREGRSVFEYSLECLADLYKVLGEDDAYHGVCRLYPVTQATKVILSLEQQDDWSEAQGLMRTVMTSGDSGETMSNFEKALLEEHFLSLARKMQQWDDLDAYAGENAFWSLKMECMWQKGRFDELKKALDDRWGSHDVHQLKLFQITTSLLQWRIKESDEYLQKAVSWLFQRWIALPEFRTSIHSTVLHNIQQLYELQESARALFELEKARAAGQTQQRDSSAVFNQWRDRIPNEWEDISFWNEIVSWRLHFFKALNESSTPAVPACAVPRQLAVAARNEFIWTLLRFARILRKNKLTSSCRCALDSLKKSREASEQKRDTSDQCLRIIESAKCALTSESTLQSGLESLAQENVEQLQLQPIEKATIHRLRAEFYHRLNQNDTAYQEFLAAVRDCHTYGKVWLPFGRFCDAVHQKHERDLQWADYAIACYASALQRGGTEGARCYLPRILWLLHYDSDGTLAKTLEGFLMTIPAWTWLPYISHLIAGLSFRPPNVFRTILSQIAQLYPQALFYHIRAFYMTYRLPADQAACRRDASSPGSTAVVSPIGAAAMRPAASGDSPMPQPGGAPPQNADDASSSAAASKEKDGNGGGGDAPMTAPPSAEDATVAASAGIASISPRAAASTAPLPPSASSSSSSSSAALIPSARDANMRSLATLYAIQDNYDVVSNVFRKSAPSFLRDCESLLAEMHRRLRPDIEDELVRSLSLALRHCFAYTLLPNVPVPGHIRDELLGIYRTFFEPPGAEGVKSLSPFQTLNRDAFKKSLVESDGSLMRLVATMKSTIMNILEGYKPCPHAIALETICRAFVGTQIMDIEIPGQYVEDGEPMIDRHDRLDTFLATAQFVYRNFLRSRRVTMRAISGKLHHFVVHTASANEPLTLSRGEERVWQLVQNLNRLFGRFRETQRRGLRFSVPVVVPLHHRLRLVGEKCDFWGMSSLMASHCRAVGVDPGEVIPSYWKSVDRIGQANVETSRRAAFQSVCDLVVMPPGSVADRIGVSFGSLGDFLTFRRHFTQQLGIASFICFMLRIEDMSLEKMSIGPERAEIQLLSFHPLMDEHCDLLNRERIPFRLTRSLRDIIGPVGAEGLLQASMTACALCLKKHRAVLENMLRMFFRDELISSQLTYQRPGVSSGATPFISSDEEFREVTNRNVSRVLHLVSKCEPLSAADAVHSRTVAHSQIQALIDAAQNADLLSRMDPSWHPWF